MSHRRKLLQPAVLKKQEEEVLKSPVGIGVTEKSPGVVVAMKVCNYCQR